MERIGSAPPSCPFTNAHRSLRVVGAHGTKGRSPMRKFSDGSSDADTGKPRTGSIEAMIEEAVVRAFEASLGPYVHRLAQPEPIVFTAAQVASVLQVSEDTVWRLVKRGVLPRVPHLDGKLLIPKEAVNRLINPPDPPPELEADVTQLRPHRSRPRHTTGGP